MDASEPAVSQPPSARAGCGCLKGCAIALAVLFVLALAGGLGAWAFGRPWLARRLPAWEASQPLLTPLLDYSGLRARLLPAPDAEAVWEGRRAARAIARGCPRTSSCTPPPSPRPTPCPPAPSPATSAWSHAGRRRARLVPGADGRAGLGTHRGARHRWRREPRLVQARAHLPDRDHQRRAGHRSLAAG